MWVGLSAKQVESVEVNIPLEADTNTGKLVADIEALCQNVRFYKTNLAKCLPLDEKGKIRYPSILECVACYPNLLIEIQEVKPKVILLLGGKVAEFVLEKFGCKMPKLSYDYEAFQYDGMWFVSIHHPSYISVYKRKEKNVYIQAVKAIIDKFVV